MGLIWDGVRTDERVGISADVMHRRARQQAKRMARAYEHMLMAQAELAIARMSMAAWVDSGLPVLPGLEVPGPRGGRSDLGGHVLGGIGG